MYSAGEFKILKEELKKIKKDNSLLKKEKVILTKECKKKNEVIQDLDTNNYKERYNSLKKDYDKANKIIVKANTTIDEKVECIDSMQTEIDEIKKKLQIAILKLEKYEKSAKTNSSNSSKPSGSNGFKKVITNRREKSTKSKGGQKCHAPAFLSEEKLDNIIESSNSVLEVIEVGKVNRNKHKEFKVRRIIDVEMIIKVKEYRYYPDKKGKYNIPKEQQNIVNQYGNNIKAIAANLMMHTYNSTDAVQSFIESTTNCIKLSKGTLINWVQCLSEKLKPQLKAIDISLLESYYLHCDESQIKINGEASNLLCISNNEHTRLYVSKSKSSESIKKITFLEYYLGKIVKDGTDAYNSFGSARAQCISHILRYLKGIYDFSPHKGPKLMEKFLLKLNKTRNQLIDKKVESFSKQELSEIMEEYHTILKNWKNEWQNDWSENSMICDDERKLLHRFEEKDKDEILYFIHDFKIPFTNNRAETDLRPVKIKQKIGKFRSETGAICYANIRSCVNTFKKHKLSIHAKFVEAFEGNLILV